MDKVLPILEKYVQWIALGLGALFLVFMAYSYAVKQPVLVPVGGTPTVPGEVDPTIAESAPMKQLESVLKKDIGIENPPKVTPVDIVTKMGKPPVIPDARIDPGAAPPKEVIVARDDIQVPLVPKAVFDAFRVGRGVYQWAKPVPPPPEPVAGANPEAAPAFVPPAAPVEMIQRDIDWASLKFSVSVKSLADAFAAAKLPPNDFEMLLSKTAFLGVEIYRQEKQVDGTWGPETLVPPLPLYGPLLKPAPKPTATPSEKSEFRIWAAKPENVAMLMQPAFPQAIAGEPWTEPVPPPPPGAAVVPNIVNGEVIQPPGFAGGEGGAVNLTPGVIPGTENPEGVFNPQELARQSAMAGIPDPKVTIFAHDIDVVAGKTYRYRVSYFVRNPLFLAPGVKNPEYLNKLVLASEKSEWTPEMTIAPRIEFWVNKVIPGRGTPDEAEFNVYVDKGGRWEPVTVRAMPGDPIARGESDSGWSLVDVRKKGNKYYVLVTDANGKMQRREVEIDANDPRQAQLRGTPLVPPGGEAPPIVNEGGVRPPPRPAVPPRGRTPGFTVTPE